MSRESEPTPGQNTPPQKDASSPAAPTAESTQAKVISEVNSRLQEAEAAGASATSARQRAESTSDSEEKKKLLQEADTQDRKSKSAIKIAQRLQSGVWQGGASGAGIGAGVGLGLGTVVGS
ncbi:hypothetical protein LCER1_G009479, partial [Lachnellula cervina]